MRRLLAKPLTSAANSVQGQHRKRGSVLFQHHAGTFALPTRSKFSGNLSLTRHDIVQGYYLNGFVGTNFGCTINLRLVGLITFVAGNPSGDQNSSLPFGSPSHLAHVQH